MYLLQRKENKTKKKPEENRTGIPLCLKRGMERTSEVSLDDVKVHYNSDKPKTIQALAYMQGNQVYVGPGQEKHLAHELGHVVQQKRGAVHPTTWLKSGQPMNTDSSLERGADEIGKAGRIEAGRWRATIQRKVAGVLQRCGSPPPQISTGRTVPANDDEKAFMAEVKSNPMDNACEISISLKDPRCPAAQGWVKMQRIKRTGGRNILIHFVHNKNTGVNIDFKFK